MDYREEIAGIGNIVGESIAVGSKAKSESNMVDSLLDKERSRIVSELEEKGGLRLNESGSLGVSPSKHEEVGVFERPSFTNADRINGGFLEQELSSKVREQSGENQTVNEIDGTGENEQGTFPDLSKATFRLEEDRNTESIESCPPIPEVHHHPGNETGEPSVEDGKITKIIVPEVLSGKDIETEDVNEDVPIVVVEPNIEHDATTEEPEIITYRGRDLVEEDYRGNLPKAGLENEVGVVKVEEIGIVSSNEEARKPVTKGGDETGDQIEGTVDKVDVEVPNEEVAPDILNVKDDSVDGLPSAEVSSLRDKILDEDLILKTSNDEAEEINFGNHKEKDVQEDGVIGNDGLSKDRELTTIETAIEETGLAAPGTPSNGDSASHPENDFAEGGKNEGSESDWAGITWEITDQVAIKRNDASPDSNVYTEAIDGDLGNDPFSVPERTQDEFLPDIAEKEAPCGSTASNEFDIAGEEDTSSGLMLSGDQTTKDYEEVSSRSSSGEVIQEKAAEVLTVQADTILGRDNYTEAHSVKDDDMGTRKEDETLESTDRDVETDDASDPIKRELPIVADSLGDFFQQETRLIPPEQESLTQTSAWSSVVENFSVERNASEEALSMLEDQPLDVPGASSEVKHEFEENSISKEVHFHAGLSALTDGVLVEEKLDVDQRSGELDAEISSAVPVDSNIDEQSASNEASNYEEASAAEAVVTESKIPDEVKILKKSFKQLKQDADEINKDGKPTLTEGESRQELDEVRDREKVLEDTNTSAGNVLNDTLEKSETEMNTKQPHDMADQGSHSDDQLASYEDPKYEESSAAEVVTNSMILEEKIFARSFDGESEAQIGQDADEVEKYEETAARKGNSAREHDEVPAREEVPSVLDETIVNGVQQRDIANQTDIPLTEATVETIEKAAVYDSATDATINDHRDVSHFGTLTQDDELKTNQKQDEPAYADAASTCWDYAKIDAQAEETSNITLSEITDEVSSKIQEDDSFGLAGEVLENPIEDSAILSDETIKSEEISGERQDVEEPAHSQGDNGSSFMDDNVNENERGTVGSSEFSDAADFVQEIKEDSLPTEDVNEPLTVTGITEDKDSTDFVEKNLIDGTESDEKIDVGVASETKDIVSREVEQYEQQVGESASRLQVGFSETPESEPSFDQTLVVAQTEEQRKEIYDSNVRDGEIADPDVHQFSVNEAPVEQTKEEKAAEEVDSNIVSGTKTGITDTEPSQISRDVDTESFEERSSATENTENKEYFYEEGKYNIESKDRAKEVIWSEELVDAKETSDEAIFSHSELVESAVSEEGILDQGIGMENSYERVSSLVPPEENEVKDQEVPLGAATDSFSERQEQDKEAREPYEEIPHPEQRDLLVDITEADYDRGTSSAFPSDTQELSTLEGDIQKDEACIENKVEASENEGIRGLPHKDQEENVQGILAEEVAMEGEIASKDVEPDHIVQEDKKRNMEAENSRAVNEDEINKDGEVDMRRSSTINEESLATVAPATEMADLENKDSYSTADNSHVEVIEGEKRDLNLSNEIAEEGHSYSAGASTPFSERSIIDTQPGMSSEKLDSQNAGELNASAESVEDVIATEVSNETALSDTPNETATTLQTQPTDHSYEQDSLESAPANGSTIEFNRENEQDRQDETSDEKSSRVEINNPVLGTDTPMRDVPATSEDVEINPAEMNEQTTGSSDVGEQKILEEAFLQVDNSLPSEAEVVGIESNEVLQNEVETTEGGSAEEAPQLAHYTEISSDGPPDELSAFSTSVPNDVQEREIGEIVASEDDQTSRTIQEVSEHSDIDGVVSADAEANLVKTNQPTQSTGNLEESIAETRVTVIPDENDDSNEESFIVENQITSEQILESTDQQIEPIPSGEAVEEGFDVVESAPVGESTLDENPSRRASERESESEGIHSSSTKEAWPDGKEFTLQTDISQDKSDTGIPKYADKERDVTETEEITPLELGDRGFASAVQTKEISTDEEASKIKEVVSEDAGESIDDAIKEVILVTSDTQPSMSSENLDGENAGELNPTAVSVEDGAGEEEGTDAGIEEASEALVDSKGHEEQATGQRELINVTEVSNEAALSDVPDETVTTIQTDGISSSLPPEAETGGNERNQVLQNEAETQEEFSGEEALQSTEISSDGPSDQLSPFSTSVPDAVQEREIHKIVVSEDDQTSRTIQENLDDELQNKVDQEDNSEKVEQEFTLNEEVSTNGESVEETISSDQLIQSGGKESNGSLGGENVSEVIKDVYADVGGVPAADAETDITKATQPTQITGNLEEEIIEKTSATVMPDENYDLKERCFFEPVPHEEATLVETGDVEPASIGESTIEQNPLSDVSRDESTFLHAQTDAWPDGNERTLQTGICQDKSDTGMPKYAEKEIDVPATGKISPLKLGDRNFSSAVPTKEILTEEDASKNEEVESVDVAVDHTKEQPSVTTENTTLKDKEVRDDTEHAAGKPGDMIKTYEDKTSAAASVVNAETTIPRGNEAAAEVGESLDDAIGEVTRMTSDCSSTVSKEGEMLATETEHKKENASLEISQRNLTDTADLKDININEMAADIPSTDAQAATGSVSDLPQGSIDAITSASVDQESVSLTLPSEETVADKAWTSRESPEDEHLELGFKETGTGDDTVEKCGESRSLDFTSVEADQETKNEINGGEILSDGYGTDKADYGLASEAVEIADKVNPSLNEKEEKAFDKARILQENASREQDEYKQGAADEDKASILSDANDPAEGTVDNFPPEEAEGQTFDSVEGDRKMKTPVSSIQGSSEEIFEGDRTPALEESKGLNQVIASKENSPTAYHDSGLPRDASYVKEVTANLPGSTERGLPPAEAREFRDRSEVNLESKEFEGEKFSADTTTVPQTAVADNLQLPKQSPIIKPDENEEHEDDDHEHIEHSDAAPLMVESSKDVADGKVLHKKSHNHLLSGMSSKVKSSISKVKKVITGKSSNHNKEHSPKHGE